MSVPKMSGSGMSFALAQMKKFGWEEGKGLGRDLSGVKEAIKPKLKFDTTGVGHDAGEEFKFHWWDHVFNKAAKNMDVQNKNGSIEITRKEELQVSKKLLNKTGSLNNYEGFLQGKTLNKDNMSDSEDSDDSDSEVTKERDMSRTLTDEQLFKLCNGRTAHKGARHGLCMSAKLARVQEQEDRLLASWKTSGEKSQEKESIAPKKRPLATTDIPEDEGDDTIEKKKKKKKKKKERDTEDLTEGEHTKKKKKEKDTEDLTEGEHTKKKKKEKDTEDLTEGEHTKKKKKKRQDVEAMSVVESISENGHSKRKKVKVDPEEGILYEEDVQSLENNDENEEITKKKKKKKKKRHTEIDEEQVTSIEVSEEKEKKSKKKKRRHQEEN